ncbi:MAG TPA: hypothetical protein VFF40_01960 [Acidimicrobiia bacterium]|nr:hypothetical protein [Acidimicrobiia bacterium]
MAGKWGLRGILVALVVVAFGCTLVVTPNTPVSADIGWFFFNEGASGHGYFTNGPASPPAGRGSAQLSIDDTGRQNIATLAFKGMGLAGITKLQYSTFQSSSTSGAYAPRLEFDVDYDSTDSSTAYQGRLVYTPGTSGDPVVLSSWQTWHTLAVDSSWYSSGSGASAYRPIVGGATESNPVCGVPNHCTWSQLLTSYPNARIRPSSGLLLVRAGGPVTGGFSGATDNVVVGLGGNDVISDFEPGDGTIVVDPTTASQLSFGFAQETPTGSAAFVTGPAGADGVGSAQLTVDSTGGEALSGPTFAGTRIDRFTNLAYKTYLQPGYPANAPSLQFDADYDDSDSSTAFQGRFVFEPVLAGAAAVTASTWQTWNPRTTPSGWWQSGNAVVGDANVGKACTQASPCSWAALQAAYPNARVRPVVGQFAGFANAGRVWLKAGGGWVGGFAGNVDALTVGVDGVDVTYDLEP